MTINSSVYQNTEVWQSSGPWSEMWYAPDQDSGSQGTLIWPDVRLV